MDYFSKFLRSTSNQSASKSTPDDTLAFSQSWNVIKVSGLLHLNTPDERQLMKGIKSTDVPVHLQSMVDTLVWESSRTEEGDVLGTLVRLSEADRPSGIQAEVLRAVQNMVILMDEQFLVHSVVHRAVLRLLRNCVGDDIHEQLDGRHKVMGAAKNVVRSQPSEYELDLVNLLCILCSRIRTQRELLMIFFHDKHWYQSEPLTSEDDFVTITSAPFSSNIRKPEYEFLLFNYLLRFVHREGQIGDFARVGLLFLIDVAMSPGEPATRPAAEDNKAGFSSESTPGEAPSDPIADAALSLAEYIVDGDFSEVLAAGLGALQIHSPKGSDTSQDSGMLGDEVEAAHDQAIGLEDSDNPDFKCRLDHFLKLLEFLQDVVRRTLSRSSADEDLHASVLVGASIAQSTLDGIRRIFLENVLYPSILECSDADGSAVAVMSYIDIMIRTLENGRLSDLLVDFLMSEDSDIDVSTEAPLSLKSAAVVDKQTKLQRHKSSAMMLLELEAPDSRRPSEYLTSAGRFTLRDLLSLNLRSRNSPTVAAAMQLLRTLLSQCCHVTTNGLMLVIPDINATSYPEPPTIPPTSSLQSSEEDSDEETFTYPGVEADPKPTRLLPPSNYIQPDTTYTTHQREVDLYLALVTRLDPSQSEDTFSTGYDHYLRDALANVQYHPCSSVAFDEDPCDRMRRRHHLNVNDPMVSTILECLRRFLANPPEMNISLTGVLAELAACPDRSIARWLTCAMNDLPPTNSWDDSHLDNMRDDQSIDFDIEEKLATDTNVLPVKRLDAHTLPVVYSILQGLVNQMERYRQLIDNFDKYLLERRQGLLFSENLTDALTVVLETVVEPARPRPEPSVSPRPETPKSKPRSSLVSFFTPRKNKAKPHDPSEHQPPPANESKSTAVSSPFALHYQSTTDVVVEPFSSDWNFDEEDVFGGSHWSGEKRVAEEVTEQASTAQVTLSHLLDNVVILEECIKELVAIIQARRSLGIDAVRCV
ncbi:Retinoic acid induced 16-like protein-domain-containing protein [Pisolithus orientalis]|uniref:Retinoic acid induced 16-like protein-domain-containing protein n=1 Tax=Pisolithus orientalis TaxID=936130 RepID=UPI002225AE8C|nr:Retinoic acid induced 16-like protein-domain-containing protein [Pisolithus orientalis]KAI6028388.1 Retinoic acid induced 16-like protein-domain-containing protein [Pisolithus orientalis]